MPITAMAAEAENARLRNSSRRSIGDLLRDSAAMNAPSITAARTKEPTTVTDPQPSVGPWMMP